VLGVYELRYNILISLTRSLWYISVSESEASKWENVTLPKKFKRSFKNLADRIVVTSTLRTPRVETKDAGANAYAIKFAASPIPTVSNKKNVLKCFTIFVSNILHI